MHALMMLQCSHKKNMKQVFWRVRKIIFDKSDLNHSGFSYMTPMLCNKERVILSRKTVHCAKIKSSTIQYLDVYPCMLLCSSF